MTELPEPEDRAAEPAPRRLLNRLLDVTEGVLWVGLLVFGTLVALAVMREVESSGGPPDDAVAPEGIIEAEALPVRAQKRRFGFGLQPTGSFSDGRWSEDGQMFAFRTRSGDWIDLELPRVEPGPYRLELFLTKAADYGIVAVSVNGARIGEEIDLWSEFGVVPTGALDLGVVLLAGDDDLLRLELVGSNPRSSAPSYQFGIDGIRLTRQ